MVEVHVLGHRQTRNGVQFLMNEPQARGADRRRAGGRQCRAVKQDAPRIGPVEPRENADQRRFAGTVLSHEGVNLARPKRKAHPIQRLHRPEAPSQPFKGKNMRGPGECRNRARGHSSDTFATVTRRVGT